MTNETARILQAQAAWAVARIVHDLLFSIPLIIQCRLYTFYQNNFKYRKSFMPFKLCLTQDNLEKQKSRSDLNT